MLKEKFAFNLDLFQPKSSKLIGVDISSSAVKMVELDDIGRGAYRLERYIIEPLPKEAVNDGNIANHDAVMETLNKAWRKLGSRVKNVALSLPDAMVITKKIVVQGGQREEDLELQVEAEANQYIPFALDEVNLDFQVLGSAPNSPDEVEVLIAASRKEKVEDRVAVADGAGLKPMVMDMDSFATYAAFRLISQQLPANGVDQNVAIVDIGAHMMHFSVLRNDQTLFSREQAFGGNQLTQDIQRAFNLSYEEAELAKRRGGLPDNYDMDVLQPFVENVALEVARALQFFYTSTSHNQVDHIVLAGGCSMIPGLDETVAKRTSINTIIGNPFASMPQAPRIKPKELADDGPSLLVACGLAMRRFDS
jgi:type IV pilus assembly protein PilM